MANKFKGIIPVQTANLSAIAAGIALVGGSFYLLGNSFYNGILIIQKKHTTWINKTNSINSGSWTTRNCIQSYFWS